MTGTDGIRPASYNAVGSGVFGAISWYRDGPTAGPTDVRIVWEDDRLEQVIADAAEYDLVAVDADPDDDCQPRRSTV